MKPSVLRAAFLAAFFGSGGLSFAQEPAPPSASTDGGAVIRQTTQRLSFDTAGRRTLTVRTDVEVTSAAGLEAWSSLDIWFSPDRETATLVSLEIIKPSGDRIRPGNLAMEDRRASGIFDAATFSDVTARHVAVPSVAVGDRLLYEYTIVGRQPDYEGGYAATLAFPTDAVIREAFLEVDVPATPAVQIWARPGLTAFEDDAGSNGRRRVRWRRTDLVPAKDADLSVEALISAPADVPDPDVVVTSFESWQAVGAWYAAVLATVAHDRAPIAAKARALTVAGGTAEEKLAALFRFVARDIRYVSLSFGIGRFQPRPPQLVLETGYGDCKDKHVLLAALAREIGITVDPVLISATDTLVADAPTPSQFDHVISVWRRSAAAAEWYWMDSTSGLTRPGVLLPHLRDKLALLVEPSGAHATVSTPKSTEPDAMMITATGELAADGAQTMTVTRRLEADRAWLYRMVGAEQWSQDQARQAAKELLETDGLTSSTITNASFSSGDDPWGPLEVRYTATVKYGLAQALQKRALWVSTPSFDLPDPEKLGAPWRLPLEPATRLSLTVTYRLPEAWQVEVPVDVTLAQPFARYRSRYRLDGRTLHIERTLDVEPLTLGEDARAAYTRFRKSIEQDRAQEIGIRVTAAAVETTSASSSDLYTSGLKEFEARRFDRARDVFLQVTQAQPTHPLAWNELGRSHLALMQLDLAQKAFERQIMVDPLHGHAYSNLGLALAGQQRPVEAEAAYRKQIEVSPLDKMAHRYLGQLLLDTGRATEAVTAFETAVALARQDPYPRVQLGRAHLAAKQPAKAIEAFEIATSATPNPQIMNEAAWRLVEHDVDLPRARSYAERGIATASGAVGAMPLAEMRRWRMAPLENLVHLWDTLGWIAYKQGDLTTARTWLEAAFVYSDSAEVSWHVGLLREKEGKVAAALHAYARSASAARSPKAEAAEAVKRLEKQGAGVKGGVGAADLESRRSTVRVPALEAIQRGEILVSIDTGGAVNEVTTMSGDVPASLAGALKGATIPGGEVARARQVRLFRAGSVECQRGGTCTIVWHRFP